MLAPALLAFTAAIGHDDDGGVGQSVVGSNGFGLVARFIAFTNNKDVVTGFGMYALAKSVYFRYIDRGHPGHVPSRHWRSRSSSSHALRASTPPQGSRTEYRPEALRSSFHKHSFEVETMLSRNLGVTLEKRSSGNAIFALLFTYLV